MYRKSFEVIGYTSDGAMFCLNCFEGKTCAASPVFLGDEYDPSSGDVCDSCLQYLDGHEPNDDESEVDDDEA